LDRSLSSQVPTDTGLTDGRPSHHSLFNFNGTSQDYGEFFAGFPWTLYGCGTYRKKPSIDIAGSLLKRYFRDLGRSINAPVAYIAVPERRTSGCGYHPIPLHWHFLAAGPSHRTTTLLLNAQQLWTDGSGNAAIGLYDRSRPGAHYLAKLAGCRDFNFYLGNLDRLRYQGPKDLFKAAINNDYVPAHSKGLIRSNTLVLRDNETKLPVSS
jgi:hypothetical protein